MYAVRSRMRRLVAALSRSKVRPCISHAPQWRQLLLPIHARLHSHMLGKQTSHELDVDWDPPLTASRVPRTDVRAALLVPPPLCVFCGGGQHGARLNLKMNRTSGLVERSGPRGNGVPNGCTACWREIAGETIAHAGPATPRAVVWAQWSADSPQPQRVTRRTAWIRTPGTRRHEKQKT